MQNKRNIIIIVIIAAVCIFTFIGYNHFNGNNDNIKNEQLSGVEESDKDKSTVAEPDIDLDEEDKITKEYLDSQKEKVESKFSLEKAIEICKNKYGNDADTIYSGEDKLQNINGKYGYVIQIKSKMMMEQGGTGILFTVLVTEDGEIIEI